MPGPTVSTTVQLFVTCLVDAFFPQVGVATVTVLERLGETVEFPADQTCCGQPAFNAGHRDEARKMARHTVEVLDATSGPIVVPSGSCAEMLVHHIPALLEGDEAHSAAVSVAGRVAELTMHLADRAEEAGSASTFAGSVTYHPSCHGLRGLRVGDAPVRLIDAVPGVERAPLADAEECCGFGGLFSVKMPDVSGAILATKLANIEASGASCVAGGDVSCLMHIAGGLHRSGSPIGVHHVAEILATESSTGAEGQDAGGTS
jgi:L-lactate dehydrogenase complex protein LldE